MYPVTVRFMQAIKTSHVRSSSAMQANLITGKSTTLTIDDGTVTDDSTSNVRRNVALTLPNEQATWDALDTVGGEITVTQTIHYTGTQSETVPMGIFIVDVDEIGYGPGGEITIQNAPDRWGKVQKSKLPPAGRASIPGNAAWQEIKRLIEGAWSVTYPFPGWAVIPGKTNPDQSATTKVGPILWDDGDREAAVLGLCTDNSVEAYFDRNGLGVLQPIPVLTTTSPSVWTVDAGAAGVMLDADRTRDRTGLANVIIVTTSATDITFTPQEVENTTIGDPLSTAGPLGYMPFEYSSPALRNSAQARAAGLTMLARKLGVAKRLTLESTGNPALDSEDVILALLPKIDRNTARPSELHILDTITHPLAPSGTQSLTTRSTRPDTDGT